MNLIVKCPNDGKERRWLFDLNDEECYELICSQIAWRVAWCSGKTAKEIAEGVVVMMSQVGGNSPFDLDLVQDPLIKAMLGEMNRLKINLNQALKKEEE